jgi:hypothetical protein
MPLFGGKLLAIDEIGSFVSRICARLIAPAVTASL